MLRQEIDLPRRRQRRRLALEAVALPRVVNLRDRAAGALPHLLRELLAAGNVDRDVCEAVLEQMGAEVHWQPNAVTVTGRKLRGVDVDMNRMPDAAMTLAVAGLFAEGPTAIRNIYNWRVKETERLEAVCTELRKLGSEVEEGRDYLVVTPPETLQAAAIDTYDDHRMAMAFSLAACGTVPVTINDPGCVRKTFPDYFDVLSRLVS